MPYANTKSLPIAYVLWFFLGTLGAHRMYLGRPFSGMLMLLLWIASFLLTFVMVGIFGYLVLAAWWLVDALLIPAWVGSGASLGAFRFGGLRLPGIGEVTLNRSTPASSRSRGHLRFVDGCSIIFVAALTIFLVGRFGPDGFEALTSPWTWHVAVLMAAAALGRLICSPRIGSLLAVAAACWAMAVAMPVVLPDAAPARADGAGSSLRVASLNAQVGTRPEHEGLEWLRSVDADILALPECSSAWDEAIRSTGRWPHAVAGVDDGGPGGMCLYSRFPLRDAAVRTAPDAFFSHAEAVVVTPAGEVRVFAVHPPPPLDRDYTAARNAELRWFAARAATSELPVIVVGDFNETPFGRAYAAFVEASSLQPMAALGGSRGTWPDLLDEVQVPARLGIIIDHAFASRHFTPVSFEVGPSVGSDHRPIVAEVLWNDPSPASLLTSTP